PASETHQFDGLLGNWTFVEELNLKDPSAPRTVKGAWTFFKAGDGFMVNDEFRTFRDSGETILLGETYRAYDPERKVWELQFAQPGKTAWQSGTSKVDGSDLIDLTDSGDTTARARFYNISANHFSCDFEVYDSRTAQWTGKKHVEATRVGFEAEMRALRAES